MINSALSEKLKNIKLVASDCDGVLTDGGLYYTEDGLEIKRFHVLDGMGFLMLKESGIKTAIITGENNPLVKRRADKLKIDYLVLGTKDKIGALQSICDQMHIDISEAIYVGDDTFDVPAIDACGVGVVPGDALDYIKDKADYVTIKGGGRGCFREIADMVLQAQGKEII